MLYISDSRPNHALLSRRTVAVSVNRTPPTRGFQSSCVTSTGDSKLSLLWWTLGEPTPLSTRFIGPLEPFTSPLRWVAPFLLFLAPPLHLLTLLSMIFFRTSSRQDSWSKKLGTSLSRWRLSGSILRLARAATR